jgi:2-succinyl-6-hydroxy-2,4-cyclohexadiene-1-carboxylate synthase
MSAVLAHETIGDGDTTLVFAHGFTQTRDAWRPVARLLTRRSPRLSCILVDLPGHGASRDISADVAEAARLLVEVGGRAIYVGYSLGARVVVEALVQPDSPVRAAVLVSGGGGIDDAAARAARAADDDALAARIESIGVEAFLREWLAQPLFRDLDHETAQFDLRATNSARGLADSLRRCGQGRQNPRWEELARVSAPILAVAGSRDVKYVALARRIATVAARSRLAIIEDCGHSAPLQRPDAVADEIAEFVAAVVNR